MGGQSRSDLRKPGLESVLLPLSRDRIPVSVPPKFSGDKDQDLEPAVHLSILLIFGLIPGSLYLINFSHNNLRYLFADLSMASNFLQEIRQGHLLLLRDQPSLT